MGKPSLSIGLDLIYRSLARNALLPDFDSVPNASRRFLDLSRWCCSRISRDKG
jgi:hypothetical protein